MKSLKFLVAAAMMMASATGFAQFANSSASSTSSEVKRSYDRFGISYNSYKITFDEKGVDDLGLTGIGAEWIHGFSLSSTTPLYIETGLKFIYAFKSDSEDFKDYGSDKYEQTTKYTAMNLAIPVNLAYRFTLPGNSDVSITPFTGITLKYNLSLKKKLSMNDDFYDDFDYSDKEIEKFEEPINYFDKDEMGKDNTAKRFQFGWQIGAGLNYKALYLGLSYNLDFSELAKKTKTNNFAVTLGYNF